MSQMDEIRSRLQQGDRRTAQRDLARLLKCEPSNLEAWLLLAQLVEDNQRKADCYRPGDRDDPANQTAREALNWFFTQPALEMDLPEASAPPSTVQPNEKNPVREALPEETLFDWQTLAPNYPSVPVVNEEVLEPVTRLHPARKHPARKVVIIFLAIILLIAAAFGGWWFLLRKTTPPAFHQVTPTARQTESTILSPAAVTQPTVRSTPSLPLMTNLDARIVWVEPGTLVLWDKGQTTTLTKTDDTTTTVALSSDTDYAAFNRSAGIWVIEVQSTNSERLLVRPVTLPRDDLPDPTAGRTLRQFVWLPGAHILLFNTSYTPSAGTPLSCDDLFMADYETETVERLLPCGQGGEITASPDGKLAALVSKIHQYLRIHSKTVIQTFAYDPVTIPSGESFRLQPVWMKEASAIVVAVPPADVISQPNAPSRIWKIPVETSQPAMLGELHNGGNLSLISPDASRLLYVLDVSTQWSPAGEIHLVNLDDSQDRILFKSAPGTLLGWSTDGQTAAISLAADPPQLWLIDAWDGTTRLLSTGLQQGASIVRLAWLDGKNFLLETRSEAGEQLWLGSASSQPIMLAGTASASPLPFSGCILP